MTSPVRLLMGLVLAGVLATSTAARAGQIVVGNLDQDPNGPSLYVDATNYLAQQFTTGGQTATLESIVASLGNLDRGSSQGFPLVALLYADNGAGSPPDLPDPLNAPTPLTSFSFNPGTIPASGFANVQFDPTSNLLLAANTSYWFVLAWDPSANGSVYWQATQSTTHAGPGSLPSAGVYFNDPSLGGWDVQPGEPQLIQVNAAVPEPSSAALGALAIGLAAAGAGWRRARRSARP